MEQCSACLTPTRNVDSNALKTALHPVLVRVAPEGHNQRARFERALGAMSACSERASSAL
eukprot:11600432-Alexandrium_andersonii.AAC.1